MTATGFAHDALAGKVALVTGASSGIGRSLASALAGAGASVVLMARRREALDEAVSGIEAEGARAAAAAADLVDHHRVEAAAEAARAAFGPPDIVVHAAGVNLRQTWAAITPESWDRTLDLNLAMPFFLSRALVGDMIARGWGRIVTIASLQSERAMPDSIPYGASKGGVAQLTRAMAEAWSSQGVTSNAIAPGFFPTELSAPVFADEALAAALARQTAIGRNGRLEDLHGPLLFLASDASAYVTGQVLYVDGGFTAK